MLILNLKENRIPLEIDIDGYLGLLKQTLDDLDRGQIRKLVSVLLDAYERDATVFICGNGGSASTASHMACDLNKGVSFGKTKRLKVMALNDNLPTMMAYANDESFALIFVEPLKNFFRAPLSTRLLERL